MHGRPHPGRWQPWCASLLFGLALAGVWPAASAAPAADRPLKILVYGGTGMIGSRIVAECLRRGDHVMVAVRHPPHAGALPAAVRFEQADVLDAADVDRQIAGEDVVIEAVSARAGRSPGQPAVGAGLPAMQGAHFYRRVAQNLVAAARRLGPKAPRLLFVGGASTLYDSDHTLLLDEIPGLSRNSEFYMMKEALDYLRSVADVSWTVLTPALQIAPGERTGRFRLGRDSLVRDAHGRSRISAEDFAVAMLDEVHHPEHVRERFTLGY